MAQEENNIVNSIMKECSRIGGRLFRNNVGTATTKDGRFIKFGLTVGSGDCIGYLPIVITEKMVGKTVAVFLSVESKTAKGVVKPEQQNWIDNVKKMGGIAFIARSIDDFNRELKIWN